MNDHSIIHLLLVTGAADRARRPVWGAGEQVVKIVEIVEIVEIETSGVFKDFRGNLQYLPRYISTHITPGVFPHVG